MFEGQPKGLFALSLANTGERFGYYTMLAVFVLFLKANFGLTAGTAGLIYSLFLFGVYLLPLVGGMLADHFGYGRMVTIGITIMFLGYLFLSIPLGGGTVGLLCMLAALLLIALGTGFFKGNLQVMVGNLYDNPQYAAKRDAAFSIFYMAINVGALFAPTAAIKIMDWAQTSLGVSQAVSYHFAFAVACLSLVVSILIYYIFRYTFRSAEGGKKKADTKDAAPVADLTPKETKNRIVALMFVFAVVIFFWMAFHQNGLTLTYFADEYTAKSAAGVQAMFFDVTNLLLLIVAVYAAFALFQSKAKRSRNIAAIILAACAVGLVLKYYALDGPVKIDAPIFQQFNPCFVVMLTPVSLALFGWLAGKGKEPSAPRKIALGMLVAAIAYLVLSIGSMGLPTPNEQAVLAKTGDSVLVSPDWLITTYLILTFGELLLSPMGISFVSKVAPPKYKGLMMGGWFVATSIGNILVSVGGYLWGGLPLPAVWGVFIGTCLLSFVFMTVMMKRLERACA